jgi:uncharacterized membrane protein
MWDADNTMHLIADMLAAEGIDLTGWELSVATGISADGSIVAGFGVNPGGVQEAWIANISAVPVPGAVYLFASGLAGLCGVARKKAA